MYSVTGKVVEQGDYDGLLAAVIEVVGRGKAHYADACLRKSKSYDMHARFNDYVDLYEEVLAKHC